MEKVALSVILTVYNSNPYLKDCINSILNQTFKDFEFIIVDDGSFDCAKEILEEFQKKDSRIVLFKAPHKGAASSRNFGIKKAKGEYLLVLDSDDFFEKEMFSKMLKKAKEKDLDIVVSNSKKINEKTKKISRSHSFNPQKINSAFDFKGWAWDKMFKRDFILKNDLKFQPLRSSNDLFFSYMALLLAKKIEVLENEFILHRENLKNSLSSTRDLSPFCFLKAIRKLYFELKKRNLYEEHEKEFLNWAKNFSNWHIKTLKNFKNKIKAKKLADRFFLKI